jgi:hypothetical protein
MQSQIKKKSRFALPIILLTAFFLFSGIIETKAAVAVDSSSSSAAFDGIVGVSTLTWSHTVGTGNSRALFVGISTAATNVGSATARVGSITFGAQTLTRVTGGFRVSPDLNNAVELFQLVSPNSGTDTITVNLLPAAANYVVGGSVSFTGVNQATSTGTFVSTTNALGVPSNTATITVSDSVSGDLVLDVIGTSFNAQSLLPDASQTRQWRRLGDTPDPPPPFNVGAGSTKAGASPTVTMSWTLQIAQNWALGAVAVKAAPPATANEASVGGRVTSAKGRGVNRAMITMTDGSGATQTVLTNPLGYYRFKEVPTGAIYVFEVRSKQYTFAPKILSIVKDMNDLDFIANQ